MDRRAWGVIGAAYGDEGKGRTVDALASAMGGDVLVVRSNGGAQAGHTVTTPQGARHVFHHLGSGALAGASTHLSKHFVHHPMTFMGEREALRRMGACVEVTADPRGLVTTPWDMMVNQLLETARGGARHGSCGYGFGETVGRNEETPFGLAFGDLYGIDLRSRLSSIRDVWLPRRFAALGLTADEETAWAMRSDEILDRFTEDCAMFLDVVATRDDASLGSDRIVFEGAQGLMLDQRHRDFPHVTRSNTGIQNMADIALEADIQGIDAIYAMRCYLTRHGAGPMPDERDIGGMFGVVDETNVPNPWQKGIRFGLLDLDMMGATIRHDLSKGSALDVRPTVSVSCLDQAIDGIFHIEGGRERHMPADMFASHVATVTGAKAFGEAHGPSRSDQRLPLAGGLRQAA